MRKTTLLAVLAILVWSGAANAVVIGDRMLVDVGTCWAGDTLANGPTPEDGTAPDGNVWNNYQFGGQWNDPLPLKNTAGAGTTATFRALVVWNKCGTGHGGFPHNAPMGDGLYPETAMGDGRLWNEGGGIVVLEGLDASLLYDIVCFGTADTNAPMDAGTFLNGVTTYTVGGTSIGLDTTDNLANVALFTGVPTDGAGTIQINVDADPGVDALLSVLDVTAVPEPATIGLLALGATALIRRKR